MPLNRLIVVAAIALLPATLSAQHQASPSSARVEPQAISGTASSGRNCVAAGSAGVHYIGYVTQNSHIKATFSSDFDPVASLTMIRIGEAAPNGESDSFDSVDDDSGGGFDPLIEGTTPVPGFAMLVVTPYRVTGPGGCYFYKVEITTP